MNVAEISAAQSAFLAPTWQSSLAQHPQQGFGEMLVSGAQQVDTSVAAANSAVLDFALGKAVPPHQVMMALEDARLSLQFALQVRSRLVEGYQELMRMQL
ncbi:flagellar hook-basal body complex protein FliE [Paraburkholderia phenazinium]|uniref:Flagellar hook-basal body complex protein FliE n=1 Tax=Paraburkholderia phenazinium TaxID=60549 RepID=A0A1G8MX54_9BURK|nr:flagellar hook-basal body complex protein FliE [Paraburkholderia phenazinium]SDI72463.1 flagellar hook-basal body complex protein FliE [Paraburkholderia phenazinium]